jgi:iron complex transport system substrate-binding protein
VDHLRNYSLCLVLFVISSLARHTCLAQTVTREITDSTGTIVSVVEHPQRIVTLAPSLAELASDFLGMDLQKIVGVTESTDYPPALKSVTKIGQYQRVNLEKIVSLKPDLVLATEDGNSKDQINHLREAGLPVIVLSTNHFYEIDAAMKTVAEALGVSEESKKLIERFEKGVDEIRQRGLKRKDKKRVLIQLDDDPLVVAGGRSFLNEAIELVGAKNIYADSATGYPRPSKEDVMVKNPDMIIVPTFGPVSDAFRKRVMDWTQYPMLQAVKTHQIKAIYGDPLLRPSMRLLEGLSLLEKTVYDKQ